MVIPLLANQDLKPMLLQPRGNKKKKIGKHRIKVNNVLLPYQAFI